MKTIALSILMAGLAMAAKAAIAPAAAATAPTVPCAVEVAEAAKAVASAATLPEAMPEKSAVATATLVAEVDGAKPLAFDRPVELKEAREEPKTAAPSVGEVPPATAGDSCSLVGMYSRCRLLSGPWSVKRRLEAARIRGDDEEVERLKALLEEVIGGALEAEGTEP